MHTIQLKGEGFPLLMLHGWGQSLDALSPLAQLLTSVCSPHLVDLPGFGKSKAPETVWSAYDYADCLVRYLDMQGIERISILGHSFGGKVAMCLALRYPERVEKLILIAASGISPRRSLFNRLRMHTIRTAGKCIKNFDSLAGTKYFTTFFASRFGSRDYKNAGNMRSILVKSVNEDLTPHLHSINCGALLLWGENDQETPLEAGKRLSCLIPQSSFYSFPYHDHQLFHDAGAHLCARYISAFLKKPCKFADCGAAFISNVKAGCVDAR